MEKLVIEKFEDFVNEAYDPMSGATAVIEKDRSVIRGSNDNRLKIKQDDQKIKLKAAKPKDEGELLRYEFKVVTKNMDDATARQDSLNHLANMVVDQMNKNFIKPTMSGFMNLEKAQQRLVGDYIVAGVLSFYDSSTLPGISTLTPITVFPFPAGTSAATPAAPTTTAATPNLAGAGVTVEEANSNGLNIYNFTDMPKAKESAKNPTKPFNVGSVTAINKAAIPDPPATTPTAPATPAAPTTPATPAAPTTPALSYETLAKSSTPNGMVKDLQARIIFMGQTDTNVKPAADLLLSKGGADGLYGDATAQAISYLTTLPPQTPSFDPPVDTIDKAKSDQLVAILGGVSAADVYKTVMPSAPVQHATTPPPTPPEPTASPVVSPQSTPAATSTELTANQVKTNNPEVPILNF